ncbi:MAG: DUF5610 domain-containing protein [Ruminiclostridium sp.]|nr:DUF5610 domain-containing protein [Ruminiclostridium sp.]
MLSVGRVMEQSAQTYATQPKSAEQISEKKDTTLAADSTDKFVKSGATFSPSYTKAAVTDNRSGSAKSGTDPDSNHEAANRQTVKQNEAVPQAKSALQLKNEGMKDYVRRMFNEQYKEANKTDAMKELEEILNSFDENEHEEDYWGAEKTANRILDFAKQLADGDDSKFEELKKGFEQGFSESEKIFGGKGKLPTVSYETYDRVQKGFDDWANELAGTTAQATAQ